MYLKGVGPQRAAMLQTKGLETVADLLSYSPFRYEDRSNLKPLRELAPGEMATVIVEVSSLKLKGLPRMGLLEVEFRDETSGRLRGKWFHGAYLQNVLVPGLRVALYGKVESDSYSRDLLMMHPEFEVLSEDDDDGDSALHTGRVVPIYEAAGKISAKQFRVLTRRVLDGLKPVDDPLPENIRTRLKLPPLWTALNSLSSAPLRERTLTGLSLLLQSNALRQALQPFTLEGPWGSLLDGAGDKLTFADLLIDFLVYLLIPGCRLLGAGLLLEGVAAVRAGARGKAQRTGDCQRAKNFQNVGTFGHF